MASLSIENLTKRFGTSVAVDGLDLAVQEGELVALLGPSGCGKTTTLRMVAGFLPPTSGRVLFDTEDVTRLPAHKRSTGMVFQSYALFPHMTAAQNVGFGLEMRGLGAAERQAQIEKVLKLVRLSHLAARFPRELSGGQQQRVALARALVIKPKLFLLDEPLSNLDAKLRAEVRIEIRALQQRLGLTTLMVTHDREEALTMADRLVVMESGRVRQIGSPRDLYDAPQDAFVADFVGRCNILAGRRESETQFRTESGLVLSVDIAPNESKNANAFALRPERISIQPGAKGDLHGAVQAVTYLGSQTEYHVRIGEEIFVVIQQTPDANEPLASVRPEDQVSLHWDRKSPRLVPQTSV
ncbi:Fe3+/spermidine/putrescine ABC transporter ATP-binding protein [Bradyrhizobium macuxiense]|uniref:Fe3+/spermidine/putrescine ABC transporter ATP-binding protein n=1 Tax=Bradyrhizobium macuxiense TaxID=1755647 RepID=A0A109K0Y5_9BRAD|nr:ABC transporter ATP-binding protein [Bradyrhizobium macuxiense]KWV58668.1 Fe3+/spermidine/putrescine ABC transporter ATP-binding protein [Bradyrhizobium macuxiense]